MICDVLEGDGRVTKAIECFQQMQSKLGEATGIHNERVEWELSECYHERYNQRLSEHGAQVFNGDVERG